jgi:hypothetical protein
MMPNLNHVIAVTKARSPEIAPITQDTLRRLSSIGFEHALELEKLAQSTEHQALKERIAERLRVRHLMRREPIANLLAELHMYRKTRSPFER